MKIPNETKEETIRRIYNKIVETDPRDMIEKVQPLKLAEFLYEICNQTEPIKPAIPSKKYWNN